MFRLHLLGYLVIAWANVVWAQAPQPTQSTLRIAERSVDPALERSRQLQLLDKNLKELDALEQEVNRLALALDCSPQVLVSLQFVEISLTQLAKLMKSAEEMAKLPATCDRALMERLVDAQSTAIDTSPLPASWRDTLPRLCQERVASIVAKPDLVTCVGRTARFNSGGEFPIQNSNEANQRPKCREYGTELTLTPRAIDSDRVWLDVQLRVSTINDSLGHVKLRATNGKEWTVPSLNVAIDLATRCELVLGKPTVIHSSMQQRRIAERRVLPVLGSLGIGPLRDTIATDDLLMLVVATAQVVEGFSPPSQSDERPPTQATRPNPREPSVVR